MLKKIVKYGNSYALRLDRTILALLGLDDGNFVKLRIEGDTLIVKAAKNIQPSEAILGELDEYAELNPIVKKSSEGLKQKFKENPGLNEEFKDWVPGSENRKKLENSFKEIFEDHSDIFNKLGSKEVIQEITQLKNELNNGEISIEDYQKNLFAIRKKYVPEIDLFDEKLLSAAKELKVPVI